MGGTAMAGGKMTPEDRDRMLVDRHHRTLWAPRASVFLGAWLLASPVAFGYRSAAMSWSDAASGALVVVFGLLSLSPRRLWAPWAVAVVGAWLLFAPLVLWAPSAAAYLNDSLVGILLIAFAVLIPGMPGMPLIMQPGPDVPPGWSYNPSAWLQRAPMIALAWFSYFISRYLAAYQLGYIDAAWDPFFGNGTARVLESDVSRAWPVSDAGLGAIVYTLEALMGYMGGPARWRTMPWMVTFFGVLVVPLGVTSIVLVILQPLAVGAWCTLCLTTAGAMLAMIPLAVDEVVAMLLFVALSRRAGAPFWKTFFLGGTVAGGGRDERTPGLDAPVARLARASAWGVNVPWTLAASTALGVWLMAAPAVLGSDGAVADSDRLAGALVATVAVIAMAEVTRAGRYVNALLGAWVVVAPWLLPGASLAGTWGDAVAGLLLIALSFPRGPVTERYGSWDRRIV